MGKIKKTPYLYSLLQLELLLEDWLPAIPKEKEEEIEAYVLEFFDWVGKVRKHKNYMKQTWERSKKL